MSVHALPTPPALDHEAALLGILLERPALLAEVAIRPEHYANPLHSVIHEAITAAVAEHGQAAGQGTEKMQTIAAAVPAIFALLAIAGLVSIAGCEATTVSPGSPDAIGGVTGD